MASKRESVKWKWDLSRGSLHKTFKFWKVKVRVKVKLKLNLSRGSLHGAALQGSSSSCGTSEWVGSLYLIGCMIRFWHNSSHLWETFEPKKVFLSFCCTPKQSFKICWIRSKLTIIPSPPLSPVCPQSQPPTSEWIKLYPLANQNILSTSAGGSRPGCMLNRFATKARFSLSWPFTTSWGKVNFRNISQICVYTFSCTQIYNQMLGKRQLIIWWKSCDCDYGSHYKMFPF